MQRVSSDVLSPQCRQHGDDLLLAAHHLGQEELVILGLHIEGLLNNIVAAHIQDVGAFQQHIGNHQNNNMYANYLIHILDNY